MRLRKDTMALLLVIFAAARVLVTPHSLNIVCLPGLHTAWDHKGRMICRRDGIICY